LGTRETNPLNQRGPISLIPPYISIPRSTIAVLFGAAFHRV
jgi:hypothetical protein